MLRSMCILVGALAAVPQEGERRPSIEDSLPDVESEDVAPRQELFDIEREVVEAVWNEIVRDPVLARFDEELDAALER